MSGARATREAATRATREAFLDGSATPSIESSLKTSQCPQPAAARLRRGMLHGMTDGADFDLDAAALRSDGGELTMSIEVLASKLEQALPSSTKVQRRGGGLLGRGQKRVCELVVQLGPVSYSLEVSGARLQGFRQKEVGGIAIKRESLDPGAWITELASSLRAEAQRSTEAQRALAELIA